jgi:hypothetical protein
MQTETMNDAQDVLDVAKFRQALEEVEKKCTELEMKNKQLSEEIALERFAKHKFKAQSEVLMEVVEMLASKLTDV